MHSNHCREILPFWVRESQCPFPLRQNTQASSKIPIAKGSLHFRCLWKVGLSLHSKPGNQLSSREDIVYMKLSWSCCAENRVPLHKGSQATCRLWCVTQGRSRSKAGESGFVLTWFGVHQSIFRSCVDIIVLLDLWQCSSGLYLVPSRKSRFLTCLMENTVLLSMQCRGIGPQLRARGKSHGFLKLPL